MKINKKKNYIIIWLAIFLNFLQCQIKEDKKYISLYNYVKYNIYFFQGTDKESILELEKKYYKINTAKILLSDCYFRNKQYKKSFDIYKDIIKNIKGDTLASEYQMKKMEMLIETNKVLNYNNRPNVNLSVVDTLYGYWHSFYTDMFLQISQTEKNMFELKIYFNSNIVEEIFFIEREGILNKSVLELDRPITLFPDLVLFKKLFLFANNDVIFLLPEYLVDEFNASIKNKDNEDLIDKYYHYCFYKGKTGMLIL